MINIVVEKKAKAPKHKLVQLRCNEELYKKIKALVPKDNSVSMHEILISILTSVLDKGNLKVQVKGAENEHGKKGTDVD